MMAKENNAFNMDFLGSLIFLAFTFQGYLEPFLLTYFMSADRQSDRFKDVPDRVGATFKDRKKMLEAEHSGRVTKYSFHGQNTHVTFLFFLFMGYF